MENAVKALLIAAGVLIGVVILSLGINLYTSLGEYVKSAQENMVSKETQQFNEQFVKYINCDKRTEEVDFTLTIQDIVTAANTAYENNIENNLTKYENNNYYVTIKLDGTALEKNISSKTAEMLANGLGQTYKCSLQDVKINEVTGRVYEVEFYKVNN